MQFWLYCCRNEKWIVPSTVEHLKHSANGRNIDSQQLPTLLDVTWCVRLHTLLYLAACCCAKFGQQLPTFLWSVTMFGSVCKALQKFSVPRPLITHGLLEDHSRVSQYCRSNSFNLYILWHNALLVPTLLGVVVFVCTPLTTLSNNFQHFLASNVGNCCVRLHDASDMDWRQQQHAQRTEKAGRPNASCEMYTYLLGVIVSKV